MNILGFTKLNVGSENVPEKDQNIQSLISLLSVLVTEGNTLKSGQNEVNKLFGDLKSFAECCGKGSIALLEEILHHG